jgi:hypothetical protein
MPNPPRNEANDHLSLEERIVEMVRVNVEQELEIQALEARIAAVRHVIETGGHRISNGDTCIHGVSGRDDCIGCYDESLIEALDSLASPPDVGRMQ